MEVDISIIIPVYNKAKYLRKTLDSLIKQTFINYEIILIDDASTDKSIFIIHDYVKKDKRLRLIPLKKNKGAGYARNIGLKEARGKYLLFLDADDFFENRMLEVLYNTAQKNNAEIVICGLYDFDENTEEYTQIDELSFYGISQFHTVFSINDISDCAFQCMREVAWNKLFLKDFVWSTGIEFQEQHNANDQLFVFANLLNATKIVLLSDSLIYYRLNTGNQLSNSISENMFCILNATIATIDYLRDTRKLDLFKKSLYSYVVDRLIFSLNKVSGDKQVELYKYYQETGWKQLHMKDCKSEEFINDYYYRQYLVLRDRPFSVELWNELYPEAFWNSPKIELLLNTLKKEKIHAVLWGIGYRGKKVLEKAEKIEYRFKKLIDMNHEKIGCEVGYYTIESPQSLKANEMIIITSSDFTLQVNRELKNLNGKYVILDMNSYLAFDVRIEDTCRNIRKVMFKNE